MKYLITFFLLFLSVSLSAQGETGVLQLKNGIVYSGDLIEYIPENHVAIKLPDGRIITVADPEIYSLSVGRKDIIKSRFLAKSEGYYNNTLLGPQLGQGSFNAIQTTFALTTVNGYKINGHHAGVGLGLEGHLGNWYAPIYADYSYHILKGKFSPLLGASGGFLVPFKSAADRRSRYDYAKGSFVGGRIGIVAYSNPHFAFTFQVSYRYIHLSGAEYRDHIFPGSTVYSGTADLHRVGVMIGFVIN